MNREPDNEVHMILELTSLCQKLRCLPGPGGLLDQDSYLVDRMKAVLIAQAEKDEVDRKQMEQKAKSAKGRS